MIFKRAIAKLRAQDWWAISIELAIVIVGVFIGTWVANINQERIERGETRQMLRNLRPELQNNIATFEAVKGYYSVTRKYADTAFAGWRGDPAVPDRDFVIAAYQASQTNYTAINSGSWAEAFGNDRLSTIPDAQLRRNIGVLMSVDYDVIERETFSDYRRHVRQVIPEDIQDAVRTQCGDKRNANGTNILPPTCTVSLPDSRLKAGADALRSNPQLVGELRWHRAAVATYIDVLNYLENTSRFVIDRVDRPS